MQRRLGRLIFKTIPLWSWRVGLYSIVAALLFSGSIVLGLRYWVLPNVDHYRADIEAALTKATGQRISIGQISGDWHGLRPRVTLGNVTVYDKSGQAALTLSKIDKTLSWLSLLFLEPRFYSLEIQQPEIAVRRFADGSISIAGIEIGKTQGGGGLSDWVLRQRELIIRRAVISWNDEKLNAPELRLEQVTLRLNNDFFRHRFGLRAVAPAHLAGSLDVRGDLQGRTVKTTRDWDGRIFAQLDYADLAAWKQWVALPFELAQGTGALRIWVDVAEDRVTSVVADVRLADVKARLGENLRALDLGALSGRIGWRGWKQGYELFAQQLSVVFADGRALPPAALRLRRTIARADKPASGELSANALELDALAQIADQLPIDAELRAAIARYAPRGAVHTLAAKWSGDWPPAKYDVKGGFSQLAVNETDSIPGLSHLTGTIEANEKQGTLRVGARGARIELKDIFAQALAFDELTGPISWTAVGGEYEVRLPGLNFANADLAGTLQGRYQTVSGRRGIADLTGVLTRADARQVAKYLPLTVGKATRDWLARALVSGQTNDARLRLKGDLNEFPFDRQSSGVFEVKIQGKAAVLDYANGWPRIENITADVTFIRNRMEIRTSAATILGTQLTRVNAVVPDLKRTDEIVEISGDAEGPTAEFLRFIAESPVSEKVDRFTERMEAQGRGRLALKLTLPLRALKDSRVTGNYQFLNNQLRVDRDLPALDQVNGRLDFSENAVRGSGISAQVLGGAASINFSAQSGTVDIRASGRASVDQLTRLNMPWLNELSGTTDWRSSITMRETIADWVIESSLQGVASRLPAPLNKSASEALPLRIQRQAKSAQHDQINWTLGSLISGTAVRRRDGQKITVERVAIGLGTEPPSAESAGVWVHGSLKALDLDRWRSLMSRPASSDSIGPPLTGVDLKIGALDVFGRRINDVTAAGRLQSDGWRARVSARELSGDLLWQSQGKGRLTGRLAKLVLPPPLERASVADAIAVQPGDYPALDVIVEDFHYKGKALGRLELTTVPEGRDWRIERLQVRNPDGSFAADGSWQWRERAPRTQLNVRLDAQDVAKLLVRLGYPEGMRASDARLSGALSWTGAPQDIDYPTLSGDLKVEAGRGQFLKLDPGIGKLLSILSLQALPRRVALDFKDVFSEGFTFDQILGVIKLQRGVGVTDGFSINGSSAKVVMSGEVDFAQETQKLRVRVTPSLGDSVATVTAFLGGPVAGIGVFLAQKLLNDPLGQLIAYDYNVTGTWSEPNVTKVQVERITPERD